jgi:hypothetical protein
MTPKKEESGERGGQPCRLSQISPTGSFQRLKHCITFDLNEVERLCVVAHVGIYPRKEDLPEEMVASFVRNKCFSLLLNIPR